MITRGDIVDFLVRDGESLALTPDRCLRLTDVSTAILAVLDRPRSRAEVEEHVSSLFGPPPQGRLDEVLAELVGQGLVVLGEGDRP